jgi:hypothetical protein
MFGLWKSNRKQTSQRSDRCWASLCVEPLESRLVPYAASSNAWPNPQLITISFVPDGTVIDGNGDTSSLFSTFNAEFGSMAAWQNAILKAAQVWAQQTNINFAVVPDNGTPLGQGLYQQGDPGVGDIRVCGYSFGTAALAQTFLPPPVNNTAYAGDFEINTDQSFNNGGSCGSYDLFTVAVHEIGHSLGLFHSGVISADMYAIYTSAKTGLTADDIQGIQSIYGVGRSADAYGSANSSFAAATNIPINNQTYTAQLTNLNIKSTSLVEYFKVSLPGGATGLTVSAQSSGLSLLEPRVTVYASNQLTVLGTAGSAGVTGGTAMVTLPTATSGQTYFIKVQGYDSTAFGTGTYDLSLSCGPLSVLPVVRPPSTQVLDGAVPTLGGGQAISLNPPFQINTGAWAATTDTKQSQSVAMDANGNYVVVWSSNGEDGAGWGVFAQRFSYTGASLGSPFQVNTCTRDDQTAPTVAMAPSGAFVITWSSHNQDGAGWGVYAQLYNADGTTNGGEFRVNTTTQDDQMYSSVAMDGSGNFVVAWQSHNQDGAGWGVCARLFSAQGVARTAEFRVNTYTQDDQMYPSVAMDAAGDFVITWQSHNEDGNGWGIYAQRYSAGGVAQGGEFRVNTTTANDQTSPTVAMNATTGAFIIAWAGRQTGLWEIYAQRYSASGAALYGEFQVNMTTTGNQINPSASMDGNGNFMITWTSCNSNGTSAGIFAQQYDGNGTPIGAQFGVDLAAGSNQQFSSVTLNSAGNVVVVWTATASNGTTGIFGQRYLLAGSNGQAAMTATDAMTAQTTSLPVVGSSTTSGTGISTSTSTSNGHPAGCTCPLCQALARALGLS